MTTSNHPENQQTQGGAADLGQIIIKTKRICEQYELSEEPRQGLSITYYGNHGEAGDAPVNQAQIVIHMERSFTSIYANPNQLRQLAAYFCAAAQSIEDGQREFNEFQYYGK